MAKAKKKAAPVKKVAAKKVEVKSEVITKDKSVELEATSKVQVVPYAPRKISKLPKNLKEQANKRTTINKK